MSSILLYFAIPEMAHYLSTFLAQKDLANLLVTCRAIRTACRPFYFSALNLLDVDDSVGLIHSATELQALAAHAENVRLLICRADFVSHHLACAAVPAKPNWVPLDTTSPLSSVVFMPLIQNLSKFQCKATEHQSAKSPCLKWSLQVVFFTSQNKNLVHLCLCDIDLCNAFVIRVLAHTINSLSFLKHLELVNDKQKVAIGVLNALFFACPFLLEVLTLCFKLDKTVLDPNHKAWDMNLPIPVRQMPLWRLQNMRLPSLCSGYPLDVLLPILDHCPSLRHWEVPCFEESAVKAEAPKRTTEKAVTKILKRACPELQELSVCEFYSRRNWNGIVKIIRRLQVHYLTSFVASNFSEIEPGPMMLALQHHTESLQELRFTECSAISSKTILGLLSTCRSLKHMQIQGRSPADVALEVEDAIRKPWTCKNLEELELSINFGYDNTHQLAKYNVHATCGTQTDTLSEFYKRIGSLERLQILHLNRVSWATAEGLESKEHTMPALLSLGNEQTRGYLSYLSGLQHLRELRGSVRADTVGTMATLGLQEVRWIHKHWKRIERISFMPQGYEDNMELRLPHALRWLRQERPTIKLCA